MAGLGRDYHRIVLIVRLQFENRSRITVDPKKSVAAGLEEPNDFDRMITESAGEGCKPIVENQGCIRSFQQISRSTKEQEFRAFHIPSHDIDARNISLLHKNVHRGHASVFMTARVPQSRLNHMNISNLI